MPDWFTHEYLKTGNAQQQKAYSILQNLRIMERLAPYRPVLCGSIPLGIGLQTSDLDICLQSISLPALAQKLRHYYGSQKGYREKFKPLRGVRSLLVRFRHQQEELELVAQPIPLTTQMAYLHMLAEYRLLQAGGSSLKQEVIRLKEAGFKTEPAFARALGLKGNPYLSLQAF